jgi:hypothetical protein
MYVSAQIKMVSKIYQELHQTLNGMLLWKQKLQPVYRSALVLPSTKSGEAADDELKFPSAFNAYHYSC